MAGFQNVELLKVTRNARTRSPHVLAGEALARK